MIERLADTNLLVGIAIATFVVPAVFLAVVVVAGLRRQRGHVPGPGLTALVSFLGGLSLGTLLLFADEAVLWLPLLVAVVYTAASRWRAGRHVQAGWLVAGFGLPSLLGWLVIVLGPTGTAFPPTGDALDALVGPALLALGGALTLGGVSVALRGDPPPPAPSMAAPAGQPGSRDVGSIAAAIREPSVVGPFGLPEIAMLVGFTVAWLVVPLAIAAGIPPIVRIAISAFVAALLATEAYLRAMTTRTRRAFEAFSWLGEWELARVKSITGGGVPTSPEDAERWLAGRPERPPEYPIRIEILAYARRFQEAHSLLAKLPATTPWEVFEIAALRDLVGWREGGDGDLAGMEEAAREILPRDGDDRLRAEVTIAVAKVRRLMAAGRSTPDEAVRPFLEVRELLGNRADGQVGRALRPRIIPGLTIVGVVLGLLGEVFMGGGLPLF